MSIGTLLNNVATVERQAGNAKDAAGGLVRAWMPLFTDMSCRIQDATAAQQERYAQLQMDVSHVIYCEQGGIHNGDRLAVAGDDGATIYFLVNGARQFRSTGGIATYWQITANEVKPL